MSNIGDNLSFDELQQLFSEFGQSVIPPPPEYRLYYDDDGRVRFYSCENLEGKYIVITKEQYAECRADVLVINEKIVKTHTISTVSRLEKNLTEGYRTSKYDINILVDSDLPGNYWKKNFYDIRDD